MVGYGRIAGGALALILCAPLAAPAQQPPPTHPAVPPITPPEGVPALVPLGHTAGEVNANLPEDVPNPLQGSQSAIQNGKKLFVQMNCAGCHGYNAQGNMGPNLTDKYWRYGGTPVDVFKSIFEGRPQGMPAWGGKLTNEEIWELVSYIQSLGGTFPADYYHQAEQGDFQGELVAPEIAAAAKTPPHQPPAATEQQANQ